MLTKIYSDDVLYAQVFKITIQVGENHSYGSGVLLTGGQYILTAAHLFSENPSLSDVHVVNAAGQTVSAAAEIYSHPNWVNNPTSYNHDLAIIKLAQPQAITAGYQIYRATTEIGQTFIRAGYFGNDLVAGKNTYDALSDIVNTSYSSHIEVGSQLLYDYDDGSIQHDVLGQLFNLPNLGLGSTETMSQSGLSGGGTFIDGKIAGIGSFIFSSSLDIDSVTNSSFGELGSDTRISIHADWIDYITKGNPIYTAPTTKSEVMTNVPEPNYGSVVNYFFAAFNNWLTQDISFNFRTLNGTAIAGEDYVATQGQITLHTGQNHVAIPVAILGDKIAEADETFLLEVSQPIGFNLPNNALVLTATHTIIDNDKLLF